MQLSVQCVDSQTRILKKIFFDPLTASQSRTQCLSNPVWKVAVCEITTTATWYCCKITPWLSFFEMVCVVFMVSDKLTRTSLVYTVVHVAAAVSLFAACTCLHSKH